MSATGPSPASVVVLSGPSGAGKTTVARRLLEDPAWERVVTATTRAPRPGEEDGRDYHFLDEATFRRGIADGAFLEHAEVYDHLYGTPRSEPARIRAAGRTCLLVVDVQGARTLRSIGFEALYVFLAPPEPAELRRRLQARGEDGDEVVERRLAEAARELEEAPHFDHVVVNDEVEAAAARIRALAASPGGA